MSFRLRRKSRTSWLPSFWAPLWWFGSQNKEGFWCKPGSVFEFGEDIWRWLWEHKYGMMRICCDSWQYQHVSVNYLRPDESVICFWPSVQQHDHDYASSETAWQLNSRLDVLWSRSQAELVGRYRHFLEKHTTEYYELYINMCRAAFNFRCTKNVKWSALQRELHFEYPMWGGYWWWVILLTFLTRFSKKNNNPMIKYDD